MGKYEEAQRQKMYYASLKAGAEVGLYIATHIPSI
jgi:hypothetical protein